MSVFRRRRSEPDEPDEVELVEDLAEDEEPDDDDVVPAPPAPLERPQGPWDVDDAPDDEVNRIDLGSLLVPVPAETEVRVEVNPEGAVVAATLLNAGSSLQINAFAAPRTLGIWDDVRTEIAAVLNEGGGAAEEREGAFGTELWARVPSEQGVAPARFLGVDGPRWFVRGLLTGIAASEKQAGAALEAALRDLVVVRGKEAMAVRDALPLALPKQVAEQIAGGVAASQDTGEEPDEQEPSAPASLAPPERGPEITETR